MMVSQLAEILICSCVYLKYICFIVVVFVVVDDDDDDDDDDDFIQRQIKQKTRMNVFLKKKYLEEGVLIYSKVA
jgi:hypothetical protein